MLKNKPTSYLLLLAILPSSSSLLFMWLVRICETTEEDEKKHLNGFSFVALILAAYLATVIIVESIFSFDLSARIATFVVLILLLLSPIFVAIGAYKEKSYRIIKFLLEQNPVMDEQNRSHVHTVNIGQDPTEYHQLPESSDQAGDTDERKTPESGENLNPFQAMCTSSFWFLFFTTACGMGSGLTTVNNMSQIGESLGYGSLEIDTLVSLWSIWNFLGRFGAGYVSDYFLYVLGWSRPLFIAITLALMSIGYIVIALALPGGLYAGSILVGICYGSQWSLMPTIVSEIFGVVHMGTIFNTITIAGPIATYILSVRVVGYFYDKEAASGGELNICTGTHCFMLSSFIMAATTFSGALVALALFFRTRNFYRNVTRLAHPN
nr:protein NUCLEAR FUSION DEFECTIVE 4-like [Ipomoea batatas]